MTGLSLVAFLCLILVGCGSGEEAVAPAEVETCLLYTSDAADE